MVSKYYAVKDIKSIHKATVISTVFALIIGAGAYFVGSLSRLVLNNQLPEGGVDAVIPNTLLTALFCCRRQCQRFHQSFCHLHRLFRLT